MIILLIHSSEFYFRVKEKAIEKAEELTLDSISLQNTLVVFTTVEKEDENEEIIQTAVKEIIDVKEKVKANNVIIYPYAHLSTNLASPEMAINVLRKLEEKLKERGVEVYRAPFGWYKEFKINCIGHPLSELSRRIRSGSVSYEKPKEVEYCEKFGFPSSPHATFIRRAVLEWIKYQLKPKVITESEYPYSEEGLSIYYKQPEGRIIPCINEYPSIIIRYKGTNTELLGPNKFKDSKNEYIIWYKNKDIIEINLNILTYYYIYNSVQLSPPTLPIWMSPIQVRIVPVRKEFLEYAKKLLEYLGDIRVDVDDLDDGLGNKIRRAGIEWIPYVVLLGEREIKTGVLTVKIRSLNEQKSMSIEELKAEILKNDPLRLRQELPRFLSQRPKLSYL